MERVPISLRIPTFTLSIARPIARQQFMNGDFSTMSLPTSFRRLPLVVGLACIMGVSLLCGCGNASGPSTGPINGGNGGGNGAGAYTGGNGTRGQDVVVAPNLNRTVCRANSHIAGKTRWTVLVYMNAANNLQPDSLLNMGQMAGIGSDSNVNIVVQWKQAKCAPSVDCGET